MADTSSASESTPPRAGPTASELRGEDDTQTVPHPAGNPPRPATSEPPEEPTTDPICDEVTHTVTDVLPSSSEAAATESEPPCLDDPAPMGASLRPGDALEVDDDAPTMRDVAAPPRDSVSPAHAQGGDDALQSAAAPSSRPGSRRAPLATKHAMPSALAEGGAARPYVAAGFVILVLFAGLVFAAATAREEPSPPSATGEGVQPSSATDHEDTGSVLLARAMELDDEDLELAHSLLRAIDESSPARGRPAFAQIEARWADAMLERAGTTNDLEEQVTILYAVSRTETVDAGRRQQAAEILLQVATMPDDDAPLARRPAPRRSSAAWPLGPMGAVAPKRRSGKTDAGTPREGSDRYDLAAQRTRLEAAIKSGRATRKQVRMLRAICSAQGDRPCRDRCTRILDWRRPR